ncbi:MAG: propionyl-CoA synthetase, partial [Mesorhizobium sp.]
MASRYHEVYDGWKRDPEKFWANAAKAIDWFAPFDTVFDPNAGVYGRWFGGASCNTCFNAVDRHVAGGRADQISLIHDSAISGTTRKFTYAELKREVVALTSVLKNRGVQKGDRVIIYMPMRAQASMA